MLQSFVGQNKRIHAWIASLCIVQGQRDTKHMKRTLTANVLRKLLAGSDECTNKDGLTGK